MASSGTPLEPRKKPRQARSQAMVDAILEAAARVLSEEGYGGASTNRIAEVAGVSVGSLYQYFPNKDALIIALTMQHIQTMMSCLHQTMQQADSDIPSLVRSFVKAMIQGHAMDPKLHQALTQQLLQLGFEQFAAQQKVIRELVAGMLELRGLELKVKDYKMAAFILVATVESTVHVALMEDPQILKDPAFEEELVGLVVRYLCG
jgi:AcrR family transcriptional regulator